MIFIVDLPLDIVVGRSRRSNVLKSGQSAPQRWSLFKRDHLTKMIQAQNLWSRRTSDLFISVTTPLADRGPASFVGDETGQLGAPSGYE
jgi:hypothetical protein